ncbi:conserved exported hypothetical protein [uncultured Paludibacter sp.]|uniref:Outer membrane protein beta-barrel domain-containing protein n=1 Tax=uncultured Paludibacter sp. TaxID=497635 RepID=A0A653AK63_9BACT|nr:conserved exported hypothetical protein [uncultured Paludibacter sp.]
MISKNLSIKREKTKIFFIFLLSASFTVSLFSQTQETQTYNLVTNSNTFGIGSSFILDPYLSPFEYSGWHVEYQNEHQQYISSKDTLFSIKNRFNFQLGEAKHPTRINSMLFFNGNYDLGFHYHWRPVYNLTFQFGGSWDMDLGGKYISRNVNNPFSLDLYSNLNASASTNYKFRVNFFNWFSQNFRAEYGVRTPLLGVMFVPEQGVSYYELFSLNNLKDAFHFSSIHNRRAILQYLNLDIPVRFTTFRIGFVQDFLQYKANDIIFHKNNLSVQVGCVVDFYVFRGTKNKLPKNFRSTY